MTDSTVPVVSSDRVAADAPRALAIKAATSASEVDATSSKGASQSKPSYPEGFHGLKVRFYAHASISTAPEYVVEGMLDRETFGLLYGRSGSGKTFFATHLAHCIASGRPFLGRRVRQGVVVYVAAEAPVSVEKRWLAYQAVYGREELGLALIGSQVDLLNPKRVEDLISCIQEIVGITGPILRLVIIDTLAATMPGGNENQSEAMTQFIDAVAAMRNRLSAAVLVLHHPGKDELKGARGHSSLRAAVDTEIELTHRDDQPRVARVTKSRDSEAGAEFGFVLRPVVVGTDNEGTEIKSCVVDQAAVPAARKTRKDADNSALLDLFTRLTTSDDQVVTRASWLRAVREAGMKMSDDTFDRRVETMVKANVISRLDRGRFQAIARTA